MSSVNKVILIGRLGRDPEVRFFQEGGSVANVNLATSEFYKDRDGNRQEKTEWHRVVFFGRNAEVAKEWLRKGSQVYVEGRLQTKKWTDKDGNERYTTEIVGDRMTMLGGRQGGDVPYEQHQPSPASSPGNFAQEPQRSPAPSSPPPADDFDDDIPF